MVHVSSILLAACVRANVGDGPNYCKNTDGSFKSCPTSLNADGNIFGSLNQAGSCTDDQGKTCVDVTGSDGSVCDAARYLKFLMVKYGPQHLPSSPHLPGGTLTPNVACMLPYTTAKSMLPSLSSQFAGLKDPNVTWSHIYDQVPFVTGQMTTVGCACPDVCADVTAAAVAHNVTGASALSPATLQSMCPQADCCAGLEAVSGGLVPPLTTQAACALPYGQAYTQLVTAGVLQPTCKSPPAVGDGYGPETVGCGCKTRCEAAGADTQCPVNESATAPFIVNESYRVPPFSGEASVRMTIPWTTRGSLGYNEREFIGSVNVAEGSVIIIASLQLASAFCTQEANTCCSVTLSKLAPGKCTEWRPDLVADPQFSKCELKATPTDPGHVCGLHLDESTCGTDNAENCRWQNVSGCDPTNCCATEACVTSGVDPSWESRNLAATCRKQTDSPNTPVEIEFKIKFRGLSYNQALDVARVSPDHAKISFFLNFLRGHLVGSTGPYRLLIQQGDVSVAQLLSWTQIKSVKLSSLRDGNGEETPCVGAPSCAGRECMRVENGAITYDTPTWINGSCPLYQLATESEHKMQCLLNNEDYELAAGSNFVDPYGHGPEENSWLSGGLYGRVCRNSAGKTPSYFLSNEAMLLTDCKAACDLDEHCSAFAHCMKSCSQEDFTWTEEHNNLYLLKDGPPPAGAADGGPGGPYYLDGPAPLKKCKVFTVSEQLHPRYKNNFTRVNKHAAGACDLSESPDSTGPHYNIYPGRVWQSQWMLFYNKSKKSLRELPAADTAVPSVLTPPAHWAVARKRADCLNANGQSVPKFVMNGLTRKECADLCAGQGANCKSMSYCGNHTSCGREFGDCALRPSGSNNALKADLVSRGFGFVNVSNEQDTVCVTDDGVEKDGWTTFIWQQTPAPTSSPTAYPTPYPTPVTSTAPTTAENMNTFSAKTVARFTFVKPTSDTPEEFIAKMNDNAPLKAKLVTGLKAQFCGSSATCDVILNKIRAATRSRRRRLSTEGIDLDLDFTVIGLTPAEAEVVAEVEKSDMDTVVQSLKQSINATDVAALGITVTDMTDPNSAFAAKNVSATVLDAGNNKKIFTDAPTAAPTVSEGGDDKKDDAAAVAGGAAGGAVGALLLCGLAKKCNDKKFKEKKEKKKEPAPPQLELTQAVAHAPKEETRVATQIVATQDCDDEEV